MHRCRATSTAGIAGRGARTELAAAAVDAGRQHPGPVSGVGADAVQRTPPCAAAHRPPTVRAEEVERQARHPVGAAVFVVTLLVVGGVIGVIELTQRDESPSSAPATAAPGGVDFTGTYRADYGPGTDLDDKPVPNAPATTSNWAVRSECGAGGCVATAANVSGGGTALLSNMTFDQMSGAWVAVGLASAECGGDGRRRSGSSRRCSRFPTARSPATRQGVHRQPLRGETDGEVHPHGRPRPQQGSRSGRAAAAGDVPRGRAARQLSGDDHLHQRQRRRPETGRRHLLPSHRRSLHEPVSRGRSGRHADVRRREVDAQREGHDGLRGRGQGAAHHHRGYPMPNELDDPISVLAGRGNQTLRQAVRAPAEGISKTSLRGRATRLAKSGQVVRNRLLQRVSQMRPNGEGSSLVGVWRIATLTVAGAVLVQCSSAPPPPPPPAATSPPSVAGTSPPSATPPQTPAAAAIRPVTAADLGPSWHPGCPIDPRQLRRVDVNYIGFDGQTHRGDLIVHEDLAAEVIAIFEQLRSTALSDREDPHGGQLSGRRR